MNETISGVFVLDKPVGISSRQALDRVVALLPRVKMGHAGTLDPMASGVLVVCVGKATRLIAYVQQMRKSYRATLRLGQRSESHDLESPVEEVPIGEPPDADRLERCLAKFRGDILQVPPQHSAVHVGGRRAYELARQGRTVALTPRPVQIDRLACPRFDFPFADLEIDCSSGTYVRSLVRDIGDDIGCGAVMTSLVRTAIGSFRQSDAVPLDVLDLATFRARIHPPQAAVQELPAITASSDRYDEIRHGRAIGARAEVRSFTSGQPVALFDTAGELLAVADYNAADETFRPRVVLMTDADQAR